MLKTLKLALKFKSEYESAGMEVGNITIEATRNGHFFKDEQVQGNPKFDGVCNCKFVGAIANFQEDDGKITCYVNCCRNTTPEMKEEYKTFIDNFLEVNSVNRG